MDKELLSSNLTLIKDVALVILSAGTLLYSVIQNRKNRREKWVENFRKEVAKLLALVLSKSKSLWDFKEEANYSVALIQLYLDDKNPLHKKFNSEMIKLLELCYVTGIRLSPDEFREAVFKHKDIVQSTTKEIIRKSLNRY